MPGITLAEQGVPVIEGGMVIWVWRVIIGLVIINVTFVIVALVRPVVRERKEKGAFNRGDARYRSYSFPTVPEIRSRRVAGGR